MTGPVDQVRDLETSLRALEVLEDLGISAKDVLSRGPGVPAVL